MKSAANRCILVEHNGMIAIRPPKETVKTDLKTGGQRVHIRHPAAQRQPITTIAGDQREDHEMMSVEEILQMQKRITGKLTAAIAMLLVSSILLGMTSYAWFILSAAPEVKEMQVTAGANGALEIALQSSDKADNRADIQQNVGDSWVTGGTSLIKANKTWGNLVDLSGNLYGLEGISLSPARLNINSGDLNNVNGKTPLSMPQFGQDGRITSLVDATALRYEDDQFVTASGYGVKVFAENSNSGAPTQSVKREISRSWLNDILCDRIESQRENLRETLLQTITDKQSEIIDILISVTRPLSSEQSENAAPALDSLLKTFDSIAGRCVASIREALMACAIADTITYPNSTEGQEKISKLYAQYRWLDLKTEIGEEKMTVTSVAKINREEILSASNVANAEQLSEKAKLIYDAYGSVADAAESVYSVQISIKYAQGLVKMALASQGESYSQNVNAAVAQVFSTAGIWITNASDKVGRSAKDEILQTTKLFDPDKDTQFYMYSGSGLFHDMAVLLGNFRAYAEKEEKKQVNKWETKIVHYQATFFATTDEEKNLNFDLARDEGCLQKVYNAASPLKVDGNVTYEIEAVERGRAFGYSVDLAFRSSATGALQLQKKATSRVDVGSSYDPDVLSNIQGKGSTVEFVVAEDLVDLRPEQIPLLLSALRIAFIDTDSGAVWGVAKAAEGEEDLRWEYDADKEKNVPIVSAELELYSPVFRVLSDGKTKILDTGAEKESIVELQANKAMYISAIVYLDGDTVESANLSADTTQSLFGTINLQFAADTDEPLEPMPQPDFIVKKKDEENP